MRVLPIRWQGAGRRAALASALGERAGQWLRDWSVGVATSTVLVAESDADGDYDAWLETDADGARLLIGCRGQDLRRLAGLLADAGDDGDADEAIAAGIGRAALEAFAVDVCGDAAAASQWMSLVHASSTAPRHGVARLLLRVGDVELGLFLGEGLCDRLLPRARSEAATVVRGGAVLDQVVQLRASIDLGEISLAELARLAPGDIVRTDAPLDAAVEISAGGTPLGLVAALARQDTRRSLRLKQRPPRQEAGT